MQQLHPKLVVFPSKHVHYTFPGMQSPAAWCWLQYYRGCQSCIKSWHLIDRWLCCRVTPCWGFAAAVSTVSIGLVTTATHTTPVMADVNLFAFVVSHSTMSETAIAVLVGLLWCYCSVNCVDYLYTGIWCCRCCCCCITCVVAVSSRAKVIPCMGTCSSTHCTLTWAVEAPQHSIYCQYLGLGTIIYLVLGV